MVVHRHFQSIPEIPGIPGTSNGPRDRAFWSFTATTRKPKAASPTAAAVTNTSAHLGTSRDGLVGCHQVSDSDENYWNWEKIWKNEIGDFGGDKWPSIIIIIYIHTYIYTHINIYICISIYIYYSPIEWEWLRMPHAIIMMIHLNHRLPITFGQMWELNSNMLSTSSRSSQFKLPLHWDSVPH